MRNAQSLVPPAGPQIPGFLDGSRLVQVVETKRRGSIQGHPVLTAGTGRHEIHQTTMPRTTSAGIGGLGHDTMRGSCCRHGVQISAGDRVSISPFCRGTVPSQPTRNRPFSRMRPSIQEQQPLGICPLHALIWMMHSSSKPNVTTRLLWSCSFCLLERRHRAHGHLKSS